MRVLEYLVHNVMGIKDINFDLDGRHLFIIAGANGNGKSSSIRALQMALCGRSGMDNYPVPALRNGEDEGWVRVKLSGDAELHEPDHFIVEVFLKRNSRTGVVDEQFRILDSAGEKAAEPRALLKRLYDAKGFDPLEFDRMDKKKRREVLMRVVGLNFDEFKAEHKKLYDERAAINASGVRQKAAWEAMKTHEDAPSEPIVVSELMDKIKVIEESNKAIDAEIEKQKSLVKDFEFANKTESDLVDEVKRLEDQLARTKADLKTAAATTVAAAKAAKDQDKVVAKLGEKQSIDAITEEIKNASDLNLKLADNKRKEEAGKALDSLRKESEALTNQMKALAESQDKKLKEASWPVPGMSVDEEGVLLDGLPIENACTRDRTIISAKVGMSLNPKLRLFICERGGDLDKETLAALEETLKENDFQMLLELVTRSEEDEELCSVIIKDGEVFKTIAAK